MLIDGDREASRPLMRRYEVGGYPTVLLVDAESGKVLAELRSRDPEKVAEQMREARWLEPLEDEPAEEPGGR